MKPDAFYNSKTWKSLRKQKLAENPLCEYCPAGRLTPATEVDHVVAIENGGSPTAWANLRATCHECHSRKTLYVERMGKDRVPVKGCDVNGRPLDPEHHWNKARN
jgi:5-methylcytosine-specific restriction enzyme A